MIRLINKIKTWLKDRRGNESLFFEVYYLKNYQAFIRGV
jgi:hypothetical protein